MNSKYKVEKNYCNCHPETCCCFGYKVVSEHGTTLARYDSWDEAQHLADLLEARDNAKRK